MAHRIAVGVSGTGGNLRALHAASSRCALDAEIVLVFADRPCAALDWAVEQGIETLLVPAAPRGDDAARAHEDAVLADSVAAVSPELVVLAGFMRIAGPAMLAAFAGRMINLHPALLPSFPGAHAVRDALAAGVKVTGVTVHFVDDSLDGGPIVLQEAVPVLQRDIGVHFGIEGCDVIQIRRHHFDTGDFARADGGGQAARIHPHNVGHRRGGGRGGRRQHGARRTHFQNRAPVRRRAIVCHGCAPGAGKCRGQNRKKNRR